MRSHDARRDQPRKQPYEPLHSKVPELRTSKVPFTRTIYIGSAIFRLEDLKDYFRLAPRKTVGLFGAPFPITCTLRCETDPATGSAVEVIAKLENRKKTLGVHPMGRGARSEQASNSVEEAWFFHWFFKSENPAASPDYLADINLDSSEVVKGALLETRLSVLSKKLWKDPVAESEARTEKALKENETGAHGTDDDTPRATSDHLVGKECIRFQGLYVAYFTVDKESKLGFLEEGDNVTLVLGTILNRIVSLKESA